MWTVHAVWQLTSPCPRLLSQALKAALNLSKGWVPVYVLAGGLLPKFRDNPKAVRAWPLEEAAWPQHKNHAKVTSKMMCSPSHQTYGGWSDYSFKTSTCCQKGAGLKHVASQEHKADIPRHPLLAPACTPMCIILGSGSKVTPGMQAGHSHPACSYSACPDP